MIKNIDKIEISPEITPVGSVIWLHGLGADGHDFAPVAQELATTHALPPLRFILPHAPFMPVTVNNGYVMRAWYDIVSIDVDRHADQAGIKKSVELVHQLIADEKALGIPGEKIILAGFSQGAVIAMTTALNYPEPLGGLLALSGYLPDPEKTVKQAAAINHNMPIFLGHGTQDPIVPCVLGKKVFEVLDKASYPVNWHQYPIEHSVSVKEIHDIAEWLKKIL